jgi:hypothetical protein
MKGAVQAALSLGELQAMTDTHRFAALYLEQHRAQCRTISIDDVRCVIMIARA